MSRTILVHLNVEVPDGDQRNAGDVADAILAAIEVGSDDDSVRDLRFGIGVCPQCDKPTMALRSDVDNSIAYVCPTHGNVATVDVPLAEEV